MSPDGDRNRSIPRQASPIAQSRRRVMTVLGGVAGLPLLCAGDRAIDRIPIYRWNGTSLGSPSRVMICHPDRKIAGQVVTRCAAEIEQLERVFALYRPDSELARLNRDGCLDHPSLDLLTVLSQCLRFSALSAGAFDVSVQPLWDVYAEHFFGTAAPAPEGPERQAIERARKLVDWRRIDPTSRRVALARPGMALTLNGIAQGYVTDRITDLLHENGCDRVLADMGCSELRASGAHGDGRPWRVAVADPRQPEKVAVRLELSDRALCTSGGYGTKFEASGRFHHLFDPSTGASAGHYIGVSVLARSAMIADALSTTLYVMPPEHGAQLLAEFTAVSARVTRPDGTVQHLPS